MELILKNTVLRLVLFVLGGLFWKGWCEEWVVLYEDSTLAWYSDKGLSRPKGFIRISEAPELLAVGEWTRQVPKRPRFPRACHIGKNNNFNQSFIFR